MTERFLTTAQASEILGLSHRMTYDLMKSGAIDSWCINPFSKRKQYKTTQTALSRFLDAALVGPEKKRRDAKIVNIDEAEWINGELHFKRRRA